MRKRERESGGSRKTDRQMYRQTQSQIDRCTDREKDRQIDVQIDIQTDRCTKKERGRELQKYNIRNTKIV